jgi:lysyl-tRNA synthetase class 2
MLEDIIKERKKKLAKLKDKGINPYPATVKRTALIGEVLKNFNRWQKNQKILFLTGRLRAWRDQGKIIFADLEDESGRLQLIFNKKQTKQFDLIKETFDSGDFVEAAGKLFKTQRGEKSLAVSSARIISKSLRPLPTEWFGLKDVEERFRRRYLDLILNPEVKVKIQKRSEIIAQLRQSLRREGFIEVETPILQPLPGGALARPFITHHQALNCDFYLRVAPELYLKRLLVAGFEKIYEIGRVFRNEGIDRDHNPEFTIFEFYWAYQDWKGLMKFTEKLLKKFIPGKWARITYQEAIKKYAKKDIKKLTAEDIDEVFKKEVGPKLIKPIFITHYPKLISPFAKSCEDNPELTERFQLIVDGMEIVNGWSELNDPRDQKERLEEQERKYRKGIQEVSRLDEDFLEALEYGMPPAAGWGIGVDRLAALITKSHNIKEIIVFPTLRPK